MGVEANANTARLWSFGKPVKRVATYVKAKVAGFYSLNGESLIEFPESNKTEDFIAFLRRIREYELRTRELKEGDFGLTLYS